MTLTRIATAFAAVALATAAFGARADDYPSKPIRLVVGFTAGGGSDIIARLVAAKMSEGLNQRVVVENRPGALSMIASEHVARSAPDGYTVLLGATGSMVVNPAVYSNMRYDTVKDFVPVSLIGTLPLVLAVNANGPARTVPELINYAKANPGKANYSSAAAPFQLAAEQLNLQAGTAFQNISYKGSTDAVNAVMGNDVLATFADPVAITAGLQSGKLRALAVTSAKEDPSLPGVPTFQQLGMQNMDMRLWQGLLLPAGTPPAIVKRLQDEVARVVAMPEVRTKFVSFGLEPVSNTSAEFSQQIVNDLARWSGIAKAANVKLEM
jgi:tripartite-type tricarboxylate transporter receptor subunit TctC